MTTETATLLGVAPADPGTPMTPGSAVGTCGHAVTSTNGRVWVCVRPARTTVRRPVAEDECAQCSHWQAAFPDES